jgi:hypothetical protein
MSSHGKTKAKRYAVAAYGFAAVADARKTIGTPIKILSQIQNVQRNPTFLMIRSISTSIMTTITRTTIITTTTTIIIITTAILHVPHHQSTRHVSQCNHRAISLGINTLGTRVFKLIRRSNVCNRRSLNSSAEDAFGGAELLTSVDQT